MEFLEANLKQRVTDEMEKCCEIVSKQERSDAKLAVIVLIIAVLIGFFAGRFTT